MTEREQFEAWAKVRYAKNPHFWLRQIDDGGYRCGMADSAWDAWQAARAQPAQAVPVLTVEELREAIEGNGLDWHNGWTVGDDAENRYLKLCREVEAAVRAKMVAVPMTDAQINDAYGEARVQHDHIPHDDVARIARSVEKHHGIAGKEGA